MFSEAAKPAVTIPNGFICPIAKKMMVDPVMLVLDGNTYERNAITARLMTDKGSTASSVSQVLISNHALVRCIREFLEQHPDLVTETGQRKAMV